MHFRRALIFQLALFTSHSSGLTTVPGTLCSIDADRSRLYGPLNCAPGLWRGSRISFPTRLDNLILGGISSHTEVTERQRRRGEIQALARSTLWRMAWRLAPAVELNRALLHEDVLTVSIPLPCF